MGEGARRNALRCVATRAARVASGGLNEKHDEIYHWARHLHNS